MPVALLCVQFRNLLPSEEVLLFARALWQDLQEQGRVAGSGDGMLSITQRASDFAPFHAELAIEGTPLKAVSAEADPLAAVQSAFSQLGTWRGTDLLTERPRQSQSAPSE